MCVARFGSEVWEKTNGVTDPQDPHPYGSWNSTNTNAPMCHSHERQESRMQFFLCVSETVSQRRCVFTEVTCGCHRAGEEP